MSIYREIEDIKRRLEQIEALSRLHYSKSTYTPTYVGGTTAGATTYSIQDGFYTRIGRVVFFNGRVTWTAATGTGVARISIPFTAAAAASGVHRWAVTIWTSSVTIGAFSPQAQIVQGAAYFDMWVPANNAGSTQINVEAAGDVIFEGFFYV